eukprot:scaffold2464_cov48-Attheya_sp.AAC.1
MNQFNLKGLRYESPKKKSAQERKSVKKLTQPIPFTFSTSKNPRQGEYAEAKKNGRKTMAEQVEHFSSKGLRCDAGKKKASSHVRNTYQRPKPTQPIPFNFSVGGGESGHSKKNDRKTMAEDVEPISSNGPKYDSENESKASSHDSFIDQLLLTEPDLFNLNVLDDENAEANINDPKTMAEDVEPISSNGPKYDSENESKASSHDSDSNIDQLLLTEPDLLNSNVLDDENAEANINDHKTKAEDVEPISSKGLKYDSENESKASSHDSFIDQLLVTEPDLLNLNVLDGENVEANINDPKTIAEDVEPISSKGLKYDSENESKASSHDSNIDQLPLTEPDLLNLNVLDGENAEANINDPKTMAEDVEPISSKGLKYDSENETKLSYDSENESKASSHDHNIDELPPTQPGVFSFSLLDEWAK